MFNITLAAILSISTTASAQEAQAPAATETAIRNSPGGLWRREGRNQEAVVIGWGEDQCPNVRTNGAQHMRSDEVAVFLDAATDSRVRCLGAGAASSVATTAAQRGEDVSMTVSPSGRLEVNTGAAAQYAALGNAAGGYAPGWPTQAAMDVAALQAINAGGYLPPPPPPPPPPRPPAERTLTEAERRAAAAAAAAGR